MLFLTGLSGSGKSTIARDLRDVLSERGDRRVSLLDGDLVRQLLSAGLTFSREDRDLNIARIGFVAAEIARHGGIAICAPIAPFAAARARVRRDGQRGRRLPAHPRRHAGRGLRGPRPQGPVRQGPGRGDQGSSPGYPTPTRSRPTPTWSIDTSLLTEQEAVAAVLRLLTAGGWLAADKS